MKESLGKYCIVLMPDETTLRLVKKLHKTLSYEYEVPKTPPHITLRESFFTSKINDCVDSLSKECSDLLPLDIRVKGFEIFSNSYLVIKVEKTPRLLSLHKTVMVKSQKFVETYNSYSPKEKLSRMQKDYLIKYNNPYVFQYYNPHISVAKLTVNADLIHKKLKEKLSESIFTVNNIAIVDKLNNKIYRIIRF